MKYVSIDIETTGLDYNKCDIIEFAAVIEDTLDQKAVNKLNKFNPLIHAPSNTWEPVAKKMNAEWYYRELKEPGKLILEPFDLVNKFKEWLKVNGIDPSNFTVAGKNFATFDLNFLRAKGWSGHHRRVLDPSILYFDPLKDEVLPDTKECLKRSGYVNLENNHRALDDAQLVILLIRKGLRKR